MTDKNKYTYLVTVQPLDRYFFGSEKSFIPADGSKANYLVRSLKIPQQTTLLGMIRYAILKNLMNCDAIDNIKYDADRIGANSFNGDNITKYGIIDCLSPLFLIHYENGKQVRINLQGFDYQRYNNNKSKKIENVFFEFIKEKGKSFIVNNNDFLPHIEKYKPKNHIQHIWQNEFTKEFLTETDIFGSLEQPGNQKSYTGATLNDAFFKQTFCYLKKPYRFAFYIDVFEKFDIPNSFNIFMGGDQSEFKITIEEGKNHFTNEIPDNINKDSLYKITFVSDTCISNNILKLSDFSINEITDFRHINTNINMKNFADLDTDNVGKTVNSRPVKSSNKFLVKKGSVFYVKDNNIYNFINNINNQIAYKKIGYNYYNLKEVKI